MHIGYNSYVSKSRPMCSNTSQFMVLKAAVEFMGTDNFTINFTFSGSGNDRSLHKNYLS